jgi:TetR/AcrR family transcriptional regulator, mexJK operon transcriptional repressor
VKEVTRQRSAGKKSKRERVVAAATKLFLGQGYGTTGMDAIAMEAGVSKATVYSYYEDKASLFADVMLRMCDDVGGHDVEGLITESPEETLKALAAFFLARMLESLDRRILQRVVAESKEFPELGKRFWNTGPARMVEALTGYLADADRRGLLAVKDPRHAAERFVGLVSGFYLLPLLVAVRSRPSEQEIRRDLDDVISGFLATLRRNR